VSPTETVTKNKSGLDIHISGDNFECPKGDCSRIRVLFTNAKGDKIYVKGDFNKDKGTVYCLIPAYPAPETLTVDVTFND
jgi:hypothetical protein